MLRYYDEIGLFLPEKVDRESGYRLYSRNQDPMLQWILTLKSLGFSLEEIKELFIGPVDSGKLIRALAKKKVEITREFQHSLFKSLQIQKLLSMIEKEGFIMDKTVDLSKLDVNELMDIKKKLPNMDMLVEDVENLLRKGSREPPSALSVTIYENFWRLIVTMAMKSETELLWHSTRCLRIPCRSMV